LSLQAVHFQKQTEGNHLVKILVNRTDRDP